MHKYNPFQKITGVSTTVQTKAVHGNNAAYLRDNRSPSSLPNGTTASSVSEREHGVMQMVRTKSTPRKSFPNQKKTISGHGLLLPEEDLFTVPEGKEITRPAPPGATLGNISMLLNENNNLSREELLDRMQINTTDDFWYNKPLIRMVLENKSIHKNAIQKETLENLLNDKFPTNTKQSNSLGDLEDQSDFEEWCNSYVKKETFKTFYGGDKIHNMKLTPFTKKENLEKKGKNREHDEEYLRSDDSHDDNEYVESETRLSDYIGLKQNKDIHHFMINACSEHQNLHYSGFQIDQKEKEEVKKEN